jgi:hypothetical protein
MLRDNRSKGGPLVAKIEGLQKYQRRTSARRLFHDLPPELRKPAFIRLQRMLAKHYARGREVKPWLYGILCGQAKRLTLNPPSSAWGRSMHAKRGGYAVQRKNRLEGGNPTARATAVHVIHTQDPASGEKDTWNRNFRPPAKPDMAEVRLSGTASGLDGLQMGRNLVRQVTQAVQRYVDNNSRFGRHIVPTTENWDFDVLIRPVPRH